MAYQSVSPNDGKLLECAIAFEKPLLDAGAPVGADTNLLISYEQSDRVIDDPRVTGAALTDIAPGNPAFRDGFFGPVVSLFRVKSEVEVIARANDLDSGLAGSVWTKDEARGLRVAGLVDTAMMLVDNIDWTDAELPFGGIKHSGYGRELGRMGIQEFVNKKLVRSGRIAAPL